MIFIQNRNPFGHENLIIEEDENSIWAYLIDNEDQLIMDGFICSTGKLVESSEEIKTAMDKGSAPPLLSKFKNEHSIQKSLNENDLSIEWVSEDELIVSINENQFLRMIKSSRESYSKAINNDGPYGKVWK